MEKKIKTFKGFPRYIGFYSLIYGIILLFFSIFGIFAVIYNLTSSDYTFNMDIFFSQLTLIISLIVSGLLLIIAFYGLLHSKNYARITGILSGNIIILGTIISSLLVKASFTLEVYAIIIIPSIVLILSIVIFWKGLKF